MSRLPNAVKAMLVAAAIILASTRAPRAQEPTPDPRLLLNLDLFTAQSSAADASNGGDSMLEQIRTLRAMGYLNGKPQGSTVGRPLNTGHRPPSNRDSPSNTLDFGEQQ